MTWSVAVSCGGAGCALDRVPLTAGCVAGSPATATSKQSRAAPSIGYRLVDVRRPGEDEARRHNAVPAGFSSGGETRREPRHHKTTGQLCGPCPHRYLSEARQTGSATAARTPLARGNRPAGPARTDPLWDDCGQHRSTQCQRVECQMVGDGWSGPVLDPASRSGLVRLTAAGVGLRGRPRLGIADAEGVLMGRPCDAAALATRRHRPPDGM